MDSNTDLLRKFQLRNMFLIIKLVYFRIFFLSSLFKYLKKINSENVTTQIDNFERGLRAQTQ